MFLWGQLTAEDGPTALDLSRRALGHDVSVVPGDPFFASDPATDRLRLSFSQGSEEQLAEGARRLGFAFAESA